MKVLMISTDREIFRPASPARRRMVECGGLFSELHIIVFVPASAGFKTEKISLNALAYPTNSRSKFLYILDAYRLAARVIKENIADDFVITAQDPFETGLVGFLLKKKFSIPLQLQAHTDFLSPYFRSESWLNYLRVLLALRLLRRANGIRVVSERIRVSLARVLGASAECAEVLPIFVDAKAIALVPAAPIAERYPAHDFVVIMASRLSKEKNIQLAIKAMVEVVKKYPKALLLIVGEGEELMRLRELARELGLSQNIAFLPWTDNLASYYKAADAYLLTSNHEGYGRSAVEAVAAGLPIVMTDVGVAGEIVVDGANGFVVPVGDGNAVTRAIIRLIAEPELRKAFASESARVASKFPTKETYLRLYRELLLKIM